MSANGNTNGETKSRFDPHLTSNVINATGPKANPRLKKLVSSLVQHLHDFCRENEVTIDEYMMGIDMVRMTDVLERGVTENLRTDQQSWTDVE